MSHEDRRHTCFNMRSKTKATYHTSTVAGTSQLVTSSALHQDIQKKSKVTQGPQVVFQSSFDSDLHLRTLARRWPKISIRLSLALPQSKRPIMVCSLHSLPLIFLAFGIPWGVPNARQSNQKQPHKQVRHWQEWNAVNLKILLMDTFAGKTFICKSPCVYRCRWFETSSWGMHIWGVWKNVDTVTQHFSAGVQAFQTSFLEYSVWDQIDGSSTLEKNSFAGRFKIYLTNTTRSVMPKALCECVAVLQYIYATCIS